MHETWVLVADNTRGRLFRQHRNGDLDLLETMDDPDGRAKAQDLVGDRPGRAALGAGRRTAMAGADPVDAEHERFARTLANTVRHGIADGRCGSAVLVAPPRMLGRMRKLLDDLPAVSESYAIDLAHTEDRDVAAALRTARTG